MKPNENYKKTMSLLFVVLISFPCISCSQEELINNPSITKTPLLSDQVVAPTARIVPPAQATLLSPTENTLNKYLDIIYDRTAKTSRPKRSYLTPPQKGDFLI